MIYSRSFLVYQAMSVGALGGGPLGGPARDSFDLKGSLWFSLTNW